jgi:hypothetical protein
MKKLVVISLILVLLTSVAFAESYFGAWGRAVFVPLYANGAAEGMTAATEVGWADVPNMAFYYSISGEEMGAEVNWDFAAGLDGPLNVWWQPNEMFKMSLGWARDDSLRGPDTIDSFAYLMGGMPDVCDIVFHRTTTADWWVGGAPGAVLSITPMEGLYVLAGLNTGAGQVAGKEFDKDDDKDPNLVANIYKNSMYSVGYEIAGIGLARVGYFGVAGDVGMNQLLQLAFRLDAVENLSLDIGFSYCLDSDFTDLGFNPMLLGLVAGYTADAFNVDLSLAASLGGDKDKFGQGTIISAIVTPSYAMDFGTIGGSFLYNSNLDADDATAMGGALWLDKAVGGGSVKVGAAFEMPAGKDAKMNFAIPVELTYSIW